LTPQEEMVVIDNLEIFKKNGFDFEIEPEAPPSARVKLTALPFSKKTSFGVPGIFWVEFIKTPLS